MPAGCTPLCASLGRADGMGRLSRQGGPDRPRLWFDRYSSSPPELSTCSILDRPVPTRDPSGDRGNVLTARCCSTLTIGDVATSWLGSTKAQVRGIGLGPQSGSRGSSDGHRGLPRRARLQDMSKEFGNPAITGEAPEGTPAHLLCVPSIKGLQRYHRWLPHGDASWCDTCGKIDDR